MPKCPDCNVELEWDDNFDYEFVDNSAFLYIAGHCENCNKDFVWREVYTFTDIDNLREC